MIPGLHEQVSRRRLSSVDQELAVLGSYVVRLNVSEGAEGLFRVDAFYAVTEQLMTLHLDEEETAWVRREAEARGGLRPKQFVKLCVNIFPFGESGEPTLWFTPPSFSSELLLKKGRKVAGPYVIVSIFQRSVPAMNTPNEEGGVGGDEEDGKEIFIQALDPRSGHFYELTLPMPSLDQLVPAKLLHPRRRKDMAKHLFSFLFM